MFLNKLFNKNKKLKGSIDLDEYRRQCCEPHEIEDLHLPNDMTALAMTYLEYISVNFPDRAMIEAGNEPGPGNRHNDTVKWIVSELLRAGFNEQDVEVVPVKGKNRKGTKTFEGMNVVVDIPGTEDGRQIIVGAHYDGDGAGDNASGAALLLATAVGLKELSKEGTLPWCHVRCIFFDGEENGGIGSHAASFAMSAEEKENTVYMVNMDSLAFGDYPCIYGGFQHDSLGVVLDTEKYEMAMARARELGFKTYETADLDGYYEEHRQGPKISQNALYSNPWTREHPAPDNIKAFSPASVPYSDHWAFSLNHMEYIYLEATNWFAEGDGYNLAFTGYVESYDNSLGKDGMFMNTEHDTWENLNKLFPGRAEEHYHVFSPLLMSLLLRE